MKKNDHRYRLRLAYQIRHKIVRHNQSILLMHTDQNRILRWYSKFSWQ